jgi:hypothetical protein
MSLAAPPPTQTTTWCTIRQASLRLGISRERVVLLTSIGQLRSRVVPGEHMRVCAEDVARLEQAVATEQGGEDVKICGTDKKAGLEASRLPSPHGSGVVAPGPV